MPDLQANMTALLKNIAEPNACRGCQATIWWVTHRNGKKTPYDPDGTNHFITCPSAKDFKKGKAE